MPLSVDDKQFLFNFYDQFGKIPNRWWSYYEVADALGMTWDNTLAIIHRLTTFGYVKYEYMRTFTPTLSGLRWYKRELRKKQKSTLP